MKYKTIIVEVAGHVATVTLNRPDKLNAFNQRMCDEFEHLWHAVRLDDDVRVIVLQANGERAFCTGVDVREGIDLADNVWSQRDPGVQLGPKYNKVWKPLVTALHGWSRAERFTGSTSPTSSSAPTMPRSSTRTSAME